MEETVRASELAVGDVIEVVARDRHGVEKTARARIFHLQPEGKQLRLGVQLVGSTAMLMPQLAPRTQVVRVSKGPATRVARAAEKGPPPATARGFEAELKRRLATLREPMEQAIHKELYKVRPKQFDRLDVEVHPHPLQRGIPIIGYLMDAEDDQLGAPIVFSKKRLFTAKELARFADVEALLAVQSKVLLAWFLQCWKRAGGTRVGRPGRLAMHDRAAGYDLKTLKPTRG